MSTRLSMNQAIRARKKKLRFVAVALLTALLSGLGVVNAAQAAVTVSGTFTGYSAADVKGYAFNTSTVTSTMTTQTPFDTDGNTSIKLLRNGAGSPLMNFTVNGGGVDCTAGCPAGDSRLAGFTFSIRDSASHLISLPDASFSMFDTAVNVTFSGASPVTIPAGSTIKFEFAPNTVLGAGTMTDQIMTWDLNNVTALDQTAAYSWFKRVTFKNGLTNSTLTTLGYSGTDFVLASDSSATTILPAANVAGYTFSGWNTVAGGTGTAYAAGATYSYPGASTILYAQLTASARTVTFNANGGTGTLAAQSSTTARALTTNTTQITKTGYTFNGWNTAANGSGTAYANGATFPFTSNSTLYAQWVVAARTVTFDANGGTGSLASQSSSTAANLTSNLSSISKAGYSFNGWNTAANGSGTAYANGASYPFTVSETLYAQWTANTNAVIYDSHGGSAVPDGTFVTGGAVTTLAAAPTRAGYTFNGWFAAASGGSALSNGYVPGATGAITLHAQWSGASNTVAYDSHGGSAVADGSFTTGGSIATLPAAPTRSGYTFDGWFAAPTGGSALSDGYSPGVATNITLHAQWSPTTNTITYDSHGGSAVPDGSFVTGGTIATLPAAPTLTGYVFQGWFLTATGGTALTNGYAPLATVAITLHAHWTGATNTITYDSHGGSAVPDGSFITGGSIATLPAAPTRAGYSFDGWFTAASGGSALSNGYAPSETGPITLHAQWTVANFSVAFDNNGGSGSMNTQSGSAAAALTTNTFTRTGYYFDGWNTAANGSGTDYANSASYPFTSSATLYAQWRAIPAEPTASAVIQVPVGSSIDNAPVALSADGLLDQSGYTVTVHSTPQIIDQGTIWSGRLNTTVRLPVGLESGWHRLVIEGTAADGTPWVETTFFEVSPSGLLLATSETDPAASLVNTGTSAGTVAPVALLFVGLGALFVAANMAIRRRRRTN